MEFTRKFKEAIICQEEIDQRLYNLLLSNREPANMIKYAMLKEAYEEIRNLVREKPSDGKSIE